MIYGPILFVLPVILFVVGQLYSETINRVQVYILYMSIESDCIRSLANGIPRDVLEMRSMECEYNKTIACAWSDDTGWDRGSTGHEECLFCKFSKGPNKDTNTEIMKAWREYQ